MLATGVSPDLQVIVSISILHIFTLSGIHVFQASNHGVMYNCLQGEKNDYAVWQV